MKLAIVTAYPPSKVTLNEYAYHLVKHFRQLEEVSEIVLLTDVEADEADIRFEEEGCSVKVINCWKFNSYRNVLTITKTLKALKPDAVLYNLQFMKFGDQKIPAALGLFAPFFSKLMGMKTIVLLHNIMEAVDLNQAGFTSNKLKIKIFNLIGSVLTRVVLKADKVALTIGNYVTLLEEKYKAKNCMLIPHGTFELAEEPTFEIPEGPMKIMTFGKFGTYKKVEVLIEAVEQARKITGKELEVVIAGTDNPNTLGYLAGVQAKYAHLPNIQFTGYVAEEDVPRIFTESAMVVFPYTSTTGSSGVLHQAGSYGKAVVMPDLGDLALLVKEEGYRGEFFEPENPTSLAQAIAKLVVNTAYRTELAKANFEAANALPMSVIAQCYLDAFKQIEIESRSEELVAA
ncbi:MULTISPECIES: glycosyltransferase [unclassified Leeuwenhoekiella]|uniref:glycosyltransferase n=1 Tax=unclassified Leeuwenhoekiella TaxID=2615029 RepID=UPI000C5221FF|nr:MULTISPECIES: glycosyltransferase [unclassified Leeuwenhoekiella]MAW97024.1 glycosyl transferase family 1 [Leeuwenhoekiella sp.]MBA80695.1 glycosyl transferase family 1 [Leeuwenhoekiella sp.]|tara:strand:- start:36080 stop:37282 length:1203 start_codon:yes stop_codon:yes gene_type:complete